MTTDTWTLDDLVHRACAALADPAYPGAPNGRVRDLPDRRAIRWYTTRGLVDRPLSQGRTARYTERHLLQVIAVKRRQAQGATLAQIQAELAGADTDTLRAIAGVGPSTGAPDTVPAARPRFWAERPAPAAAAPASTTPTTATTPTTTTNHHDSVTVLAALPLTESVTLLLPGRPTDDDVAAIRAAAAPLLTLLAERHLLASTHHEGTPT
ncbi:MAG: MerR family transcriptional regulator [Gordonia sp. (in: high G+C Gram-positive bacteria)]